MKKFRNTKQNRLLIYKYTLNLMKSDKSHDFLENGFCRYLSISLKDLFGGYPVISSISPYIDLSRSGKCKIYKEFAKYLPIVYHTNAYWFELTKKGRNKRIKILKEIIHDLETELNK